MTLDIFALCAGVIAMLFIAYPLKELKHSFFVISAIAISLMVLFISIKSTLPLFEYINELADEELGGYVKAIIKVFGITLICNITSDLTQDLGMASLAGKVEFAGRVAIIVSVIPIFDNLLTEVKTLL